MSNRTRFVSARMKEQQQVQLMEFISTMKLMNIEQRMARKKVVPFTQYLGVYGMIDYMTEKLEMLGPVDRKAEMMVADQEWRGKNQKRKRSVFDKEFDMRPSKKQRVEIPQLVVKRRREEDDLPSDALPTKKQRIVDLVDLKFEALLPNVPGNMPGSPVTGLVDPNQECDLFQVKLMFHFSLVLATAFLWQLCLLILKLTSH
ncbi:unnamed protein product [Rhizopus stolonifer]